MQHVPDSATDSQDNLWKASSSLTQSSYASTDHSNSPQKYGARINEYIMQ